MKTEIKRIIAAGIVGTVFMTLYSYMKSKQEKQEYVEPVMINKLIDNSKNMPEIKNNEMHPYGYILHFITGILFITTYHLFVKKHLLRKNLLSIAVYGSLSGLTGIVIWKFMFAQHKNPPYNNRYGYFKQLFTAHLIFSLFAIVTYNNYKRVNKIMPQV